MFKMQTTYANISIMNLKLLALYKYVIFIHVHTQKLYYFFQFFDIRNIVGKQCKMQKYCTCVQFENIFDAI